MEIMRGFQGRGQEHPLHHPQADRDHGRCRPLHRPAQGQVHRHGGHQGHHQGGAVPDDGRPRCAVCRREEAQQARRSRSWRSKTYVSPSKVPQEQRRAQGRVSFKVRAGEIVCVAGIEGNGQTRARSTALTGLESPRGGTHQALRARTSPTRPIRERSKAGMSHIPEDRHKYGLVLDYTLEENLVLAALLAAGVPEPRLHQRRDAVRDYAERLIEQYDVRSGQGAVTIARSMSGGNQQKAIIAREVDKESAAARGRSAHPRSGRRRDRVHPQADRGPARRRKGCAAGRQSGAGRGHEPVATGSWSCMSGEIVGEFDPRKTTVEELGLYMAGAKQQRRRRHE